MKTINKLTLIAIIAGLGFYNIQIDKRDDFGVNLSLIENSASANSEETAGRKVASKREETGTSVISLYNADGVLCTVSSDFHTVLCIGTGTISCTPVHTVTNQQTTC